MDCDSRLIDYWLDQCEKKKILDQIYSIGMEYIIKMIIKEPLPEIFRIISS